MATQVYKIPAKIVGMVLMLIGIGALIGGNYAGSFIKQQLEEQQITMPDEESINGQVEGGRITQEDAGALLPF